MAVMREEIFGPLLPLVPYDTLDEAIAYVARASASAGAVLFERRRAPIDAVLARTHAGGVSVNDTLCHIAQHGLPFGGVGASGMGGYHGEAGFRTFSHMKPVFHQARLNGGRPAQSALRRPLQAHARSAAAARLSSRILRD